MLIPLPDSNMQPTRGRKDWSTKYAETPAIVGEKFSSIECERLCLRTVWADNREGDCLLHGDGQGRVENPCGCTLGTAGEGGLGGRRSPRGCPTGLRRVGITGDMAGLGASRTHAGMPACCRRPSSASGRIPGTGHCLTDASPKEGR